MLGGRSPLPVRVNYRPILEYKPLTQAVKVGRETKMRSNEPLLRLFRPAQGPVVMLPRFQGRPEHVAISCNYHNGQRH